MIHEGRRATSLVVPAGMVEIYERRLAYVWFGTRFGSP